MALILSAPVMAQGTPWGPQGGERDRDHGRGGPQDRQRQVPLTEVLRELKARYGGQHLNVQTVGDHYMISWITQEGRRLVIEVDVATGRTISVR